MQAVHFRLDAASVNADASTDEVRKLLQDDLHMVRRSPKTLTSLLTGLARSHKSNVALKVIRSVQSERIEVNVFHYSSCITAFEKRGLWQYALALMAEMSDTSVNKNMITYSAGISACEKGAQWQISLTLLVEMSEDKVDKDTTIYNAVTSSFEKAAQWQQAMCVSSCLQIQNHGSLI